MNNSTRFFNRCFDKRRLKNFILWFFGKYGERETIKLIENLKGVGFQYATKAGISIGIDDLEIPFIKTDRINRTEQRIQATEIDYQRGNITEIERQQQFVDNWSLVSEQLKNHVIQFFKATDILNPIYMMAFSGARGNISQIRQLIGMRGLMADPQGQILDFPIRSNFREGLTLTEYLISCYGARKGVVDTALRTATSGYLTRRLVDVTQQVVIGRQNCYTNRGIKFTNLMAGSKTLLSLKDRLTGRVLLSDIFAIDTLKEKKFRIGIKNQEISTRLAKKICDTNNQVLLRSPLTCRSKNSVCQLCYGWNLAYNALVSIGEAVGVIAAQSIGEPGTQLTMRTFHTGGVFTGGLIDQIYAPFNSEIIYINSFKGVLIRTLSGRIGFLTKTDGNLQVKANSINKSNIKNQKSKTELINLFFSHKLRKDLLNKDKIYPLLGKILSIEENINEINIFQSPSLIFNIPIHTILFIRNGSLVLEKELIAELSSVSISENQRQEIEQEIFATITGEIFFEKLNLVEKMKRDGSIQKLTYGLGSLWLVSATEWLPPVYPSIIPSHGDFISGSSVIQKWQILPAKYSYFDQSICKSLHAFKDFKFGSFLKKTASSKSFKNEPVDNILLNQTCYTNNFRKIYYKDFRYYVYLINIEGFLNHFNLKKNSHLSFRDHYKKRSQPKVHLKHLRLGLNFRFHQNTVFSKTEKPKNKTSLLLYDLQSNINYIKENYFFSFTHYNHQIKLRLKKPVISRKGLNIHNQRIKKDTNQYWSDRYSIFSHNRENVYPQYFWSFCIKNSSKSFDFTSFEQINNLGYLENCSLETGKSRNYKQKKDISASGNYKILKFFSINFILRNFVLYFSPKKTATQYNWISVKQTTYMLLNRQFWANIQLSNLNNISICSSFSYCFNSTKKTLKYVFSGSYSKIYNLSSVIKPILINPGLFISIYNRKYDINYFFIKKFLTIFYYENLSNFNLNHNFARYYKKKGEKIGFQTQFKILTIPAFAKNIIKNNRIPLQIKKQIKKGLLTNKILSFWPKTDPLKADSKKQQNILSWPCTDQSEFLTTRFGYCLNFGSDFIGEFSFDRQQIILDITCNEFFYKFNLLTFFSSEKFHRLRIRFPAHRLLSKNLIIFQKIENNITPTLSYPKILNLNKNYNNQEYHNSLIFNFIKNYFINFNRNPIRENKSTDLSTLECNPGPLITRKIFFKVGFINNLQIKTLFNSKYHLLLRPYYCLRGQEAERFTFYKPNFQTENISCYIFNHLIYFSLKAFCFNSIQKLNIRGFLNTKSSKINTTKIFYKQFKYCLIRDLISIHFFFSSQESEVIFRGVEKQKSKGSFIFLAQMNLKSFKLNDSTTNRKSNTLMLSHFLRYGTIFENQKILPNGGQIIYIDKKSFILRQATPFLITSKSLINVRQSELITKGSRLFTFLSYQIKTGDIIQGIPKIEEFFEARLSRNGVPLLTNLHTQIKELFQNYRLKFSIFEATQKSFEKVRYLIIDEIQKVYCSQGIYIADKHLEIVIRQMTAKVQIIKGGKTGLLCGELLELDWISSIEEKLDSGEIAYEPVILGITKSCLETESFISAASFQETTRVLAKAAIQNRIDFIRGLKQNVILGNLIPAGTGFFSPLYIKYSRSD